MNSVGMTIATPIIAPDHFLLATRDAGYRNLASALTELIDNSLQAGATRVSVLIEEIDGIPAADLTTSPIAVGVLDNGSGMDASALVHALQFGGVQRQHPAPVLQEHDRLARRLQGQRPAFF